MFLGLVDELELTLSWSAEDLLRALAGLVAEEAAVLAAVLASGTWHS